MIMMMRWLSSLLLVLALARFGTSVVPQACPNLNINTCYYNTNIAKLEPDATSQYYALGGLFNVHTRGDDAFSCGDDFNPTGILHTQAFLWSLDYWQKRLGNSQVSVGAVVFDGCDRRDQLIQNLLGFEQCNIRIQDIDRYNVVGFVGPLSNEDTMAAAALTSDMDLTLISPSADSVLLSDYEKYPFFLRTTPTIQTDIDIMAAVLNEVDTDYVAAIYEESQQSTFELFKTKMTEEDVCITEQQSMSGDETDAAIAAFIRNNLVTWESIRFVALFLSPEFAGRFMKQLNAVEEADKKHLDIVFLMTSDIRQNSQVFSYPVVVNNAIMFEQAAPASVATAVEAFKTYWNSITPQSIPTLNSRLSDPFLSAYLAAGNTLPAFDVDAAFTIAATKAFVDGVYSAGRDSCANSNQYLCSNFLNSPSRGTKINQFIRTRSNLFSGGASQSGDLRADQVHYRIFRHNYQDSRRFVQIGEYSNGVYTRQVNIRGDRVYLPGECPKPPCLQCGEQTTTVPPTTTKAPVAEPSKCEPDTNGNFSIVYYPPDQEITGAYMQSKRNDSEYATRFEIGRRWIIALGVLAGLGILAVIIFEIYILYKLLGTHMGQKWRTMWLGQLLLFGIFLCYLTLFAYLPIPTKATCGITRFGVGVSYSVCFAVLLVKLMVILTSKSSENSLIPGDTESANYLKGIYQFLMFVFVVGVQVVIDAQWLITVPPEAVKVISNSGEEVWVCNHYTFKASGSLGAMTDMSNFVRNEFENHILSLVYIMFLILITTLLALNAHGIITNHRESVFIGIASGFSIPIWLAWTLVGGLNRDHEQAHEFGDGCIAFGLFITATLILFAMFLPKVRQLVNMGVEGIYFEDDRDTYYAGSVIMAPPSYKSRPNSVIYVNNQGIYSEPVVLGNGDAGSTYLRHPGSGNPTPGSTYSAPPTYLKKGADSTIRGGSVLRVTDDLSGRRPLEKKRPMSEVAYATARPRSMRGTLPRSRSHTNLGAL